jgi:hypothetical protein
MCIFDIIKKLENIKHNYLIYALEKYTDQITADDIKKRELERQIQDELAKPEIKKPADEVKKPVDEVKKPTGEVKKFENNIMDSLKWVFISMGILIFLIFVGSLIYWGLYGGNYDDDNTMTIENKYVAAPTNQSNKYIAAPINQSNKYVEPTNQSNKYVEPTNQSNKYVEPTNVEDKEGSIFSFLSPFSKKEKTSEIESISTSQLDADEYLESIKQSRPKQQLDNVVPVLESKTKAQLDADEYLESIKQSRPKQQLDNVVPVLESKTKAQLDADEYLESIKQSRPKQQLDNVVPVLESKTKAQLDADEYLESIKKSRTKQQLDTNKINEDDNVQIQKV